MVQILWSVGLEYHLHSDTLGTWWFRYSGVLGWSTVYILMRQAHGDSDTLECWAGVPFTF